MSYNIPFQHYSNKSVITIFKVQRENHRLLKVKVVSTFKTGRGRASLCVSRENLKIRSVEPQPQVGKKLIGCLKTEWLPGLKAR